jgi:hypothetical protein
MQNSAVFVLSEYRHWQEEKQHVPPNIGQFQWLPHYSKMREIDTL